MYTKESASFVCTTLSMLTYLIDLGYKPSYARVNMRDMTKKVWFFENSDKLFEDVQKYLAQKQH